MITENVHDRSALILANALKLSLGKARPNRGLTIESPDPRIPWAGLPGFSAPKLLPLVPAPSTVLTSAGMGFNP